MAEPTSCCAVPGGYCARVDALFNLPGIHVTDVDWRAESADGGERQRLVLAVESGLGAMGCPACGVVAASHGRRIRRLCDIPAFGHQSSWCGGSVGGVAKSPGAWSVCSPRRPTSPGRAPS